MDIFDLNDFICVQIEITRRCNMSCPYCYVTPRRYARPELDAEEFYAIIRHIKDELDGKRVVFHLAGGELFVKPGITGLLRKLLMERTPLSIVSNGLQVPDDIFTHPCFKKDYGCFNFQISIDGLQGDHETARIGYRRVLDNFERLLDGNVWTIIRTTLHHGNIGGVQKFFNFINEMGERYNRDIEVDVQPVAEYPQGGIAGLGDMLLSIEEYLKVGFAVDELVKMSLPRVRSSWRFVHDVDSMLGEKESISLNSACYGCGGGFGIGICANGDVVNCEMDLPFINIREDISRESIGEVIDILKEKNRPRKRCIHCHLKTICGMCRLAPIIHGYTPGFGYDDCVPFMEKVRSIHLARREAASAPSGIIT